MKKLLLTIIIFSLSYDVYSQVTAPIKEQFDFIQSNLEYPSSSIGLKEYILSGNPYNQYKYGEQIGPMLESYLNMYEATKDKAYLYKFINLSLEVMSWRKSNYLFAEDEVFYMNGLVLWPMAHFCNLVLYEDSQLQFVNIPNEDVLTIPSSTFSPNILPYQPSYTIGYIADWLIDKQVETLTVCNTFNWMGDELGYKSKWDDEYPMAINMQSGFGGALLYLGQLSSNVPGYGGLSSYLDKGAAIARLFKSYVFLLDRCVCNAFFEPVLRVDPLKNSYSWFHQGWRVTSRSCGSICLPGLYSNEQNYDEYTEYIEDISHAVATMIVPIVSEKINLFTYGTHPFSSIEMTRFKNMFTKNIFDGNDGNPSFHNAVNGAEYPIFSNDECSQTNDCPINFFRFSSLNYMPLYKFDDNDGPLVYDIITTFYENEILPSPTNIYGGSGSNGVAQTVVAQWDIECVDLTLYNRKMIYDQDFEIKSSLTVDPRAIDNYHELGDNSFAEPIITNDEFTIEPMVTVTMKAGEEIILKPGFTAKAGGTFTASIDPSLCSRGRFSEKYNQVNRTESDPYKSYGDKFKKDSVAYYSFLEQRERDSLTMENQTIHQNSLTIFPNPFNGHADIKIELNESASVNLRVLNQLGNEVIVFSRGENYNAGNYNFKITDIGLAEGIYYCILELNGQQVDSKKLILLK